MNYPDSRMVPTVAVLITIFLVALGLVLLVPESKERVAPQVSCQNGNTDLEKAQEICFGNGMKNLVWKNNRIILLECNHQ